MISIFNRKSDGGWMYAKRRTARSHRNQASQCCTKLGTRAYAAAPSKGFARRLGRTVVFVGLTVSVCGFVSPVIAAPIDSAMQAYRAGDYGAAFQLYFDLARDGDLVAQYSLGAMYARGLGVAQDHAEALKWYRQAALRGHPPAQFSMGAMYMAGIGVAQDYAEAARWFRKAADQGDPGAQNSLGLMYDKRRGVPQDFAEAVKLFRQAADHGHAPAQANLAFMYDKGRGVAENPAEAVAWYRRAAEQGYAAAQSSLAAMYQAGRGVPRDLVQAYMWYQLAADNDPGTNPGERALSLKRRDIVGAAISAEQIAEAQKQARDWRPKSATQGSPSAR